MGMQLSDNGVVRNVVTADEDGTLFAQDIMDAPRVQKVLDANHYMREAPRNTRAHGHLHASIPLPVYHTWRKEWKEKWADVFTWQTYLIGKLNDSDNALLLTSTYKTLINPTTARTLGK